MSQTNNDIWYPKERKKSQGLLPLTIGQNYMYDVQCSLTWLTQGRIMTKGSLASEWDYTGTLYSSSWDLGWSSRTILSKVIKKFSAVV